MLPTVLDYRHKARRYLPTLAFDYLDGGAERGVTLDRNQNAFKDVVWQPDVLVDVSRCDLKTTVLGCDMAMPAVVGPTGLNGLFRPGADIMLAQAAHAHGLPFAMSTASTSTLESVRDATSGALWLQLYVQQSRAIAEDLMRRARDCGFTVLLLTVDVPVHGNRDHDKRNGFQLPLRLDARLAWDVLRHPAWSMGMLTGGRPQLVNLAISSSTRADIGTQAAALSRQMDMALTWEDVRWLRRHWPGPIVVKGIQSVSDARRALNAGVDGVVLSNHGGRQLDGVASPLTLLPQVVDAIGHSVQVLVDGGVRRGSDIAKAVALGAQAVLLGRAPLYGVAAAGRQGAQDVLSILRTELENTVRLLGREDIAGVRHVPITLTSQAHAIAQSSRHAVA